MELISCKNLTLGYDGNVLLENVSFTVESGDYVTILGCNGSGKTTLMKAILGLCAPISGEIKYTGVCAKEIGYIPQQTQVQKDFPATVYEIVLSGVVGKMGLRPFYNKKDRERADSAMVSLEITDLKNRCYRELSGGQQQRVLLARAICATEKILLLDEPVTGLDVNISEELYKILENLNKEKGITIIMISHDRAAAEKYSNKILNIDGRLDK